MRSFVVEFYFFIDENMEFNQKTTPDFLVNIFLPKQLYKIQLVE